MHFIFWLILLCVLFLLYTRRLFKEDDFYKIPGPKGLFLLGNSLDFLKDSVATFNYFRENNNIFKDAYKVKVGNMRAVIIGSPEYAEKLLSSKTYNKKGYAYSFLQPWLKEGLLLSYGKKWQHRRKILTPAFHFNILRHFSSIIVNKCDTLVEKLEPEVDKHQTDILSFVADFTLNSICETAMGTSIENLNNSGLKYTNAIHLLGSYIYKRATIVLYHFNVIFKYSNLARKQNELLHLIASFRNRVLKNRRQNPPKVNIDDIMKENSDSTVVGKNLAMLDILLKAENEETIDENGISEEVDTFIFEGHDTTAAALQYTFMLLANHGDVQDKIVAELEHIYGLTDQPPKLSDLSEMKYLDCCIKESLRLYPPVYVFTRQVDEPFQLKDGIRVSGVEMAIFLYDMHRREDQFVEPLKFMPERFMVEPTWHRYAYIPFSAGPRNCIGQKFAMMEMKLAISSVLRKYRLLPVTKPEDMVFIADLTLRTRDPIYVKFERRHTHI